MDSESKIEKIKKFIETCPLLKGNKINVDYLKNKPASYSIDQTPSKPIINKDIIGNKLKQITFDFTVQADFSILTSLSNSKFCEEFTQWIEEQNDLRKLPEIEGIREINCTSPGYILQKTETTAIYVIQMNCIYFERRIQ